jgi:hypothetical protein
MESKQRAAKAALLNWKVSVKALEASAMKAIGLAYTSESAGSTFLKLQFWEERWKATVCAVVLQGGTEMLQVVYRDRSTAVLHKSEVVKFLAGNKLEKLADNREWQMHLELVSYRMVITLHFLIDFDSELKHLSLIFQTRNLTISDVVEGLERAITHLDRLKIEDGNSMQQFRLEYDVDSDSYKGWAASRIGSELIVSGAGVCVVSSFKLLAKARPSLLLTANY